MRISHLLQYKEQEVKYLKAKGDLEKLKEGREKSVSRIFSLNLREYVVIPSRNTWLINFKSWSNNKICWCSSFIFLFSISSVAESICHTILSRKAYTGKSFVVLLSIFLENPFHIHSDKLYSCVLTTTMPGILFYIVVLFWYGGSIVVDGL